MVFCTLQTASHLIQNLRHHTVHVVTGSMEFSIAGHPDDFFPVNVSFVSKKTYCDIEVRCKLLSIIYRSCTGDLTSVFIHLLPIILFLQVKDIRGVDSDTSVKYSSEVLLYVDKYEIV